MAEITSALRIERVFKPTEGMTVGVSIAYPSAELRVAQYKNYATLVGWRTEMTSQYIYEHEVLLRFCRAAHIYDLSRPNPIRLKSEDLRWAKLTKFSASQLNTQRELHWSASKGLDRGNIITLQAPTDLSLIDFVRSVGEYAVADQLPNLLQQLNQP